MNELKAFAAIITISLMASVATAASLDEEIATLKDTLGKQLVAKGCKKVAALDFTDLQGRRNELGRLLAEQLTVELIGVDGIAVVDRANLKSILDEHKLTEEGLIKPENAKKLGQFSGLDAIIIGNVSMGTDMLVLVKAISTNTAEVVAAGKFRFTKTSDTVVQLGKSITSGTSPAGTLGTGDSVDTSAIATKDIGNLRITLKNVVPLKTENSSAKLISGIICSFEITNLDLQKTVRLAYLNRALWNGNSWWERQSKISDSRGTEWRLLEATGLPMVAVGSRGNPADFIRAIKSGEEVSSDRLFQGNANVWAGDFASILPGITTRVSMTFKKLGDYGRPINEGIEIADFFMLESQLVMGVSEPDSKEFSYSFESLVLDKIVMPKPGK